MWLLTSVQVSRSWKLSRAGSPLARCSGLAVGYVANKGMGPTAWPAASECQVFPVFLIQHLLPFTVAILIIVTYRAKKAELNDFRKYS